MSLIRKVFAETPSLLAQGPCAFGCRIGLADLLHDQISLSTKRDKLCSGSGGQSLIAPLSSNAFSFSRAQDLKPNFSQFLFEHFDGRPRLNFELVEARHLFAGDPSRFSIRAADSLDQIIEVGIDQSLRTVPHVFTG